MGSKSSSSTQKSEFITTTNENISGVDGPVASDGGRVNINTLDGGAIREAFDLGGDALDFGAFAVDETGRSFDRSLDFTGEGLDRILDFGDEVISDQADQLTNTLASINAANATGATLTSANQQETIRQVVKFAAIALGVVGVVWAFGKVVKK